MSLFAVKERIGFRTALRRDWPLAECSGLGDGSGLLCLCDSGYVAMARQERSLQYLVVWVRDVLCIFRLGSHHRRYIWHRSITMIERLGKQISDSDSTEKD